VLSFRLLALGLIVVAGLLSASGATAQTTTTPTSTTPSTTETTTATTSAPATTSPTTTGSTATSQATTTTPTTSTSGSSSSDSFPWWAVVLGVVVLAAIIVGVAARSRRSGSRRNAITAWRQRAIDEVGEIGATARLLASGTPVSAAIAQQVLTSLRSLDDLTASAPDEHSGNVMHDARQAVRALAIAIDADHAARSAQPPSTQPELDAAALGLRTAATDADGVLRNTHRALAQRN
jgi:hypothetical protein